MLSNCSALLLQLAGDTCADTDVCNMQIRMQTKSAKKSICILIASVFGVCYQANNGWYMSLAMSS